MAAGLRDRSKERGWPRPEWATAVVIEEWLRVQPACECCGVDFRIVERPGGVKCDASPTIDRLDNAKGYERENAALICWRCNNIKRDYTAADLRRVAEWVERRFAEP